MNEARVIALAGLFQSIALVRSLALTGSADAGAIESSIASIFRIDADTPADVFGGIRGVELGLRTLVHQIDAPDRDLAVTQLTVAVLRLERKLSRRPRMQAMLREGMIKSDVAAESFVVELKD